MSRKAKIAAARAQGETRLSDWKRRKIERSFNRQPVDMSRTIGPEAVKNKPQPIDLKWDADDLEALNLTPEDEDALRRMGMTCRKLARLEAMATLDQLQGINVPAVQAAINRWLETPPDQAR
jgi:hypothetical protein